VRITIYTTFIRPPPKRILNIKVSYTLIKILSSVFQSFQSVDKNVKIFVRSNIAFFSLPILCPLLNYFTSFLHPPGRCKNVSVLLLILLSVISPPFACLAGGGGGGCPLLAPLPLLCLSPCRPVALSPPPSPAGRRRGRRKKERAGAEGRDCPLLVQFLSTTCPQVIYWSPPK